MNNINIWTKEELEKTVVGKHTAVTIPVNITFKPSQKVLDLTEMRHLLESAYLISQEECYCRKTMKNCLEPMDGCLSLDEEAEEAIEKKSAKRISVDQAIEALKRTHGAGFVHMAYTFTGQEKPGIICSCCSCCCDTLTAALTYGYPDLIFQSDKVSTTDEEICTDCGICVNRCQFKARKMVDGKLTHSPEKCFGCGLCVTTCPDEAISLIDRERASK